MTLVSTKRLIKSGVTDFFRNIWISVAATSMVTITLLIIATMIILYTLAVLAIQNSTDKIGVVTAYFNQQTTEREMTDVQAKVLLLPGVKSVEYTSKAAAKQRFQTIHQKHPALLETLNQFTDAENPIPASLAIKADNLSDYPQIYNTIKSDVYAPYFDSVRDNQKVIDKLHRIIDFITKFGIILAIIFMIVTIMVTFNTIRLTIYNRREEVEIMRLVGATNWYIRWPFLIEGMMYGLFATILTSLIVLGLLSLLSGRIEQFLSISTLGRGLFVRLFWQIFEVNFVASIVLGIVASTIAMRRYLKI